MPPHDPIGKLRARLAPRLRHGRRSVVMTTEGHRLGNLLYLWMYCHSGRARGRDVRTLANSHTPPWDDLWELTERGLVVSREAMRVWDRREEVPERLHQRWGRDFTREDLDGFARDVLVQGRFAGLVEPGPGTLTVNVRRGDYYANPDYRALFAFDYPGYLEAALDLSLSRDGQPDDVRVVSDDPSWCREHLRALDRFGDRVEFLDNDPLHDLAALASSARLVLSNSTFSYWGAYLASIVHAGTPSGARVVAPAFHRRDLDGGRAWQLDPRWTALDGFW